MFKQNISLLVFLFTLSCLGQNIAKQIEPINSVEDANNFITVHSDLDSEIWTLHPDLENDQLNRLFVNKKVGDIVSDKENTYKILNSTTIQAFRVSYIYLDGSKLGLADINTKRKLIIQKFKSGIDFATLAKKYNMDGNKTCDLGWFVSGVMVKEFEDQIKKHKLNDIFTVDVPEKKWYYVTIKTFDDKLTKELTILKVKNPN